MRVKLDSVSMKRNKDREVIYKVKGFLLGEEDGSTAKKWWELVQLAGETVLLAGVRAGELDLCTVSTTAGEFRFNASRGFARKLAELLSSEEILVLGVDFQLETRNGKVVGWFETDSELEIKAAQGTLIAAPPPKSHTDAPGPKAVH